jgi:hypothetical protein
MQVFFVCSLKTATLVVAVVLLSGCQQVMERLANDLGGKSIAEVVTHAPNRSETNSDAIGKAGQEPVPVPDYSDRLKNEAVSQNPPLAVAKPLEEKKLPRTSPTIQRQPSKKMESPAIEAVPQVAGPAPANRVRVYIED